MAQDVSLLMEQMLKQDPWRLRMIGREAGLPLMRKKRAEAKTKLEAGLWDKLIKNERLVIKAAKQQNQSDWDLYNQKNTEICQEIKLAKSLDTVQ